VKPDLRAARHDRSASVGNGVDHVKHVTPADVRNLSVLPIGKDITLNRAPHDIDGPVSGLIAPKPFLEYALEIGGAIGTASAHRIASGLDVGSRFTPNLTRFGKLHGRISAERHSAQLAPKAIEINEGLATPVGDPQSEPGIALVEAIHLPAYRWL
jgi:hypothetical protein